MLHILQQMILNLILDKERIMEIEPIVPVNYKLGVAYLTNGQYPPFLDRDVKVDVRNVHTKVWTCGEERPEHDWCWYNIDAFRIVDDEKQEFVKAAIDVFNTVRNTMVPTRDRDLEIVFGKMYDAGFKSPEEKLC